MVVVIGRPAGPCPCLSFNAQQPHHPIPFHPPFTYRLSRLGVQAEILTKVGDDAYGKMITDELSQDGLVTARVMRKAGITSPFTYVIVDVAGQTRTCIHTPSEGAYVWVPVVLGGCLLVR